MFSGGAVDFGRANFTGGTVGFGGAKFSGGGGQVGFGPVAVFSGGTVSFGGARFAGGKVYFGGAVFSGGEVDFSDPEDWSVPPAFPPAFPWTGTPSPGVILPKNGARPSKPERGNGLGG